MPKQEDGKMGEIAKWFKSEAGAFAHEVAVRHDKDIRDDEAEHQFRRDMERVTAAFAELGADEHKMRELLRKWFGIDSMEEADFYIEQGAQIEYPVTLLEEYLKREGYEAIDVIRFKKKHSVVERLRGDSSLFKLTAKQLKQRMEQDE